MAKYEAGFIGAGSMGGALAQAAVKTAGGGRVAVACSTPEHSEEAAARLKERGVEPVVEWTAAPKNAPEGTARVVRAYPDGRLTVARFPDQVKDEDHS